MQGFCGFIGFYDYTFGQTYGIAVNPPDGTQVLFYGHGLSGFLLRFGSPFGYAEAVGLMQIRALPNLINNTIYLTTACGLSDFDDDGQQMQFFQNSNLVLAITGMAAELDSNTAFTVGNYYSVSSGQSTASISTYDGLGESAIAGATYMVSGGSEGDEISECQMSVQTNNNFSESYFSVTVSGSVGNSDLTAVVDVCAFNLNNIGNIVYSYSSAVWGPQGNTDGLPGTVSVTFSDPPLAASNAGIMLTSLQLEMLDGGSLDTHDIDMVGPACWGPPSITNSNLTYSFPTLNFLYNSDFPIYSYQSTSSSASYICIAQTSGNTTSA